MPVKFYPYQSIQITTKIHRQLKDDYENLNKRPSNYYGDYVGWRNERRNLLIQELFYQDLI